MYIWQYVKDTHEGRMSASWDKNKVNSENIEYWGKLTRQSVATGILHEPNLNTAQQLSLQ